MFFPFFIWQFSRKALSLRQQGEKTENDERKVFESEGRPDLQEGVWRASRSGDELAQRAVAS